MPGSVWGVSAAGAMWGVRKRERRIGRTREGFMAGREG
jgi:hypothetical protein